MSLDSFIQRKPGVRKSDAWKKAVEAARRGMWQCQKCKRWNLLEVKCVCGEKK